jgi:hypothetical protein
MTLRWFVVPLLALWLLPGAALGERERPLELRDTRLTETEMMQRAEAWGLASRNGSALRP